jgi:hypothetical protein
MIGAFAPLPSMTNAARPVVRLRARPPRRSEDFGTGRDNIAACGQGAAAVRKSERTARPLTQVDHLRPSHIEWRRGNEVVLPGVFAEEMSWPKGEGEVQDRSSVFSSLACWASNFSSSFMSSVFTVTLYFILGGVLFGNFPGAGGSRAAPRPDRGKWHACAEGGVPQNRRSVTPRFISVELPKIPRH